MSIQFVFRKAVFKFNILYLMYFLTSMRFQQQSIIAFLIQIVLFYFKINFKTNSKQLKTKKNELCVTSGTYRQILVLVSLIHCSLNLEVTCFILTNQAELAAKLFTVFSINGFKISWCTEVKERGKSAFQKQQMKQEDMQTGYHLIGFEYVGDPPPTPCLSLCHTENRQEAN